MPRFAPLIERFAAKVEIAEPQACWLWTASVDRRGYGQIHSGCRALRTTMLKAHRVAYELAHGPIADGLAVLHRCDNPPCCNPAHLFAGTIAENNADMKRKDRHQRGERHRHAKLTDAVVLEIARRAGDGESGAALARAYGLTRSTVLAIVRGRTWKHLNVLPITGHLPRFPQRRNHRTFARSVSA